MRNFAKVFICVAVAVSALTISSCKKDEAPPVGGPEVEEVGAIKIPDGVVAIGSVKSLTDITTAATDIGSSFNKGLGPLIGGQVSTLIQGKLIGTRNLTWMDPTAPMKIVVLDPAKFKTPFVFIGAVAYEDGLASAMDEPVDGPDGNKISYKGKHGFTMYVNRIGKYAVFTMDPAIYGQIRDFIKKDFLRHPGTRLIDVQTTSAGFKGLVKPMVDSRVSGANMQAPTAMDLAAAELSELLELLDQTTAIRIVLGFDRGNLSIEGSALPVEGTSAARFAADGPNRKLSLFKQFPVEGWLEFASSVDPELFKGLSINSMDSVSQFVAFTPQEKAEWEALLGENVAVQSGEMALQVGYENKFPFRVMEIVGLKDGAKGRAVVEKTWSLMFGKFSKLVEASLPKTLKSGEPMPKIDFTSLETAVASSRELLVSQGVIAQVRDVNKDGVDVRAIDFSVDATKMAPDDPDLLKFTDILGASLSAGVGFDKGNMYIAFGRDAVADIAAARAGSDKSAPRMSALVSGAGYDVALAARVSLVDAAKIAAFMVKRLQSRLPSLEVMKDSPDITLMAGSRNGKVVIGALSIPVAGIAALMAPPPAGAAAPQQAPDPAAAATAP